MHMYRGADANPTENTNTNAQAKHAAPDNICMAAQVLARKFSLVVLSLSSSLFKCMCYLSFSSREMIVLEAINLNFAFVV